MAEAEKEQTSEEKIVNVQILQDQAIAAGRFASFTQVGTADEMVQMSFISVDPAALNEDGSRQAYLTARVFVTSGHARKLAELLTRSADKCDEARASRDQGA